MALAARDFEVGKTLEALLVDDLKRTQIVMYAGAAGDYNPLHTDEPFAKETAGYPSVFAHGMLTMGMIGRAVTDWVGDEQLLQFGVRFTGQVWPGDSLTVRATVDKLADEDGQPVAEFSIVTTNQSGAEVVTGYAAARLDR